MEMAAARARLQARPFNPDTGEFIHQSKKNPGAWPGFFHFPRGISSVLAKEAPQASGSEFESGKGPIQEGVNCHAEHQGAKDRIRFEQYHHIRRVAIIKSVHIQISEV